MTTPSGSETSGRIAFWFEFASTYSYLSAMRIEDLAAARGIGIEWRPFLLGPIFKAQGWTTSPFNVFPAKGRYMVRDIERIAASRGLAFQLPEPFPANGLLAARVALALGDDPALPRFIKAICDASFAKRRDIADPSVVVEALLQAGAVPPETMAKAASEPIKLALRANTEQAQALGLFGAPTIVTADGEVFWGDDRLEQAIVWAARGQAGPATN